MNPACCTSLQKKEGFYQDQDDCNTWMEKAKVSLILSGHYITQSGIHPFLRNTATGYPVWGGRCEAKATGYYISGVCHLKPAVDRKAVRRPAAFPRKEAAMWRKHSALHYPHPFHFQNK